MGRKPIDKQAAENAPRGQEHYWQVMQQLDCDAGFTLDAVYRKTNSSKAVIKEYMGRLLKAGFLEVVRSEKEGIITRHFYSIAKRSRFAPKVDRDGKLLPPSKRDHMWRTMRMNKNFTIRELVALASTDEVVIKPADAKDYIKHLSHAGYVKNIGKKGNAFKFLLIQNTGPLPPKIQRIKQVFDPNLNKVVWTPEEKA
ncbi:MULTISPECIES: hypothetical protein [unclassified Maridesulfovibrio]|uniref:hypothetical protein n=1 Tax=unclassified Maridesulfovibrio TaxID=2794999 RepID=UPI003B41AFDB